MRLWHHNDPYGVAVVRRVFLWFAVAVVVIGFLRATVKPEPFLPYVAYAVVIAIGGLLMEPVAAWSHRRRAGRQ